MKVVCIKTGVWKNHLTIGKEYEVISTIPDNQFPNIEYHEIIDNSGKPFFYNTNKFKKS